MDRLRAVQLVLGAVLLGLAVYLVVGEKPWEGNAAELLRQGKSIYFLDRVRIYDWWFGAGNLIVVALLAWTAPRWLHGSEPPADPSLAPPPPTGAAFPVFVAAAVVAAALLAMPRLTFDFWDDERTTVHYFADGGYRQDHDGQVEAWRPRWRRVLHWGGRPGPNNHVPHTIAVRLGLDAWRALRAPQTNFADERVVRVPAFLAGMAALPAVALLLRRLGFAAGGAFVACLLAIHPWFVRYASEARGYSLLAALIPALLGSLLAAFHRGTWLRWSTFVGLGAMILWDFPGAVLLVALANAAVVAELVRRRHQPGTREHLVRWGICTVIAACVWVQLMGANMLLLAFHTPWNEDPARLGIVQDVLSHLWAGTFWRVVDAPEHYIEVADLARAWPLLFPLLVATTLALVALGTVQLVRRSRLHAWLAAVLILPTPLLLAAQMSRSSIFYPFYAFLALPCIAILLGIGFESAFARFGEPRMRRAATLGAMALFVAAYAVSTQPVLHALRSEPIQPSREAVALMRPVRDPLSPANDRVLTASWLRTPFYYDPRVQELSERGELRALMQEADATDKALFVSWTNPVWARRRLPGLVGLVENPAIFEPIAELYGFEPRGHMVVYRYRGSSGRSRK